jgi:adenylate cyclase
MKDEDLEFIKRLALKDKLTATLSYSSAITPVDILKSSIAGSGNVTIPPDKDGVYRNIPLVFQCREYTIPHFILSYLIDKGKVNLKHGSLYREDNRIPLSDEKLMLRYYRQDNPFPTFSAAEIMQSYLDKSAFRQPSVKKEYFRGKKVLIGLTAAGLYDLKPTSVPSISTGVLIHATTLDNIANNNFIRPLNNLFVIFFMFCISLFISYSVLKNYSLSLNLAVFPVSLLITIAIPALVFRQGFYMNIVAPPLSLIISF